MRENKFRAWDSERKAMVDGTDIEEFTEEIDEVSYTVDCPRYQTGLSYGKLFVAYIDTLGEFTECEIMQFTGLLDKNGKAIYEGDVLRCDDGDGWVTGSGVVVFEDGCFVVRDVDSGLIDSINTEIETIIGNIHENPELLEMSE